MRMKIHGGTVRRGDPPLCVTCRHATIVQGPSLQDRVADCGLLSSRELPNSLPGELLQRLFRPAASDPARNGGHGLGCCARTATGGASGSCKRGSSSPVCATCCPTTTGEGAGERRSPEDGEEVGVGLFDEVRCGTSSGSHPPGTRVPDEGSREPPGRVRHHASGEARAHEARIPRAAAVPRGVPDPPGPPDLRLGRGRARGAGVDRIRLPLHRGPGDTGPSEPRPETVQGEGVGSGGAAEAGCAGGHAGRGRPIVLLNQ